MSRSAFVDSAVLIAAFHRRDVSHEDAFRIVDAADQGTIPPLVLTDYILAETLNFINRKGSNEMAREVLRRLEASRGFIIDRVPDSVYAATKNDVFPATSGLSFVDASTVAYMMHHGMKTLYSFDAGFDQVKPIQRLERL